MNDLEPPPSLVDLVTSTYDGDKSIDKSKADSIWKKWFSNLYEAVKENMETEDFFHRVAAGAVDGHTLVHKFGKNKAVGATYTPLAIGGVYQTPQIAGATTLRIKAGGNANDTAAGTGAREVTLQYISTAGEITKETLATAGAGASSSTAGSALRIVRAFVSESGAYASAIAGSHVGDIVIEDSAGTNDWLTIDSSGFPRSQSQIGVYTVPLGFTAYVYSVTLTTDSNKAVDFLFFKRGGILNTAAPYEAMRTVIEEVGIQGHFDVEFIGGQKFTELTDIGFMVKASTAAVATADFEIVLVNNNYI